MVNFITIAGHAIRWGGAGSRPTILSDSLIYYWCFISYFRKLCCHRKMEAVKFAPYKNSLNHVTVFNIRHMSAAISRGWTWSNGILHRELHFILILTRSHIHAWQLICRPASRIERKPIRQLIADHKLGMFTILSNVSCVSIQSSAPNANFLEQITNNDPLLVIHIPRFCLFLYQIVPQEFSGTHDTIRYIRYYYIDDLLLISWLFLVRPQKLRYVFRHL